MEEIMSWGGLWFYSSSSILSRLWWGWHEIQMGETRNMSLILVG